VGEISRYCGTFISLDGTLFCMRYKRKPETDIVDAIQIPGQFTLTRCGQSCTIEPGDWIAVDICGTVRVFKNEIFQKAFEPVE